MAMHLGKVASQSGIGQFKRGFTLIELSLVLAIIGIVAATLLLRLDTEQGDITTIQSVAGVLQSMMVQVADRFDKAPADLTLAERQRIVTVVNKSVKEPYRLELTNRSFRLLNTHNQRAASFDMTQQGRLYVLSLENFKNFNVCDQTIIAGECSQTRGGGNLK